MKELYLVRHAKSSWKSKAVSDFERPLNKRGKRDAPFMAKLIREQKIKPDLIISSPSNRALTTAKIFSEQMGYPFEDLLLETKLYEASSSEILEVLRNINSTIDSVMIFAHNPGLTDLANFLSNDRFENIPTCGIVSLHFDDDLWQELDGNSCRFLFFEYPKKYF